MTKISELFREHQERYTSDNVSMGSFFSHLKSELLYQQDLKSIDYIK